MRRGIVNRKGVAIPPNLLVDLVAYYPFTGNADDESEYSKNGTVSGATLTTDKNGKNDKAYLFDALNDQILCPSSSELRFGTGSFSFSFWMSVDSYSGLPYRYVMCEPSPYSGGSTTTRIYLDYSTGKLNFRLTDSANKELGNYVDYDLRGDGWHHHALVHKRYYSSYYQKNRISFKYYMDGGSMKSGEYDDTWANLGFYASNFSFGMAGYSAPMKLDNFRIYKRDLLYDEIQQLKNYYL